MSLVQKVTLSSPDEIGGLGILTFGGRLSKACIYDSLTVEICTRR